MAGRLTAVVACLAARQSLLQSRSILAIQPCRTRYKAVRKGKRHEEARTFEQRLDEINAKDPELDLSVNIGFPLVQQQDGEAVEQHRLRQWMKTRSKVEFAARHRDLKLELDDVKQKWLNELGPGHIRSIVDHYGVYNDLFGLAFFYNATPMSVCYDYDEEFVTPVYYGNTIPPAEAASTPQVEYSSDADTLWTLVMTSPDGNLQHNDKECLHWMVGNIPGCDVGKGETLCSYLQPFPVKGVGYLRYVFVLYRQSKRLDFSGYTKSTQCFSLAERTFSTLDFYRHYEEDLTPASLCFFQSQWDSSVRSVFHDTLEMQEPSYDFILAPNYHPAQKCYPHKEPFNRYLDRYRDVKDIQEEVLKERLKRIDPLSPPKPAPLFPNAVLISRSVPSWQKTRIKNMRLGKHQWKDLNH